MTSLKHLLYSFVCPTLMAVTGFWTGCDNAETWETPVTEEHQCKLRFEVSVTRYDTTQTRASEAWADNDCVYLTFVQGSTRIQGRAVYNVGSQDWTLYYNGNLSTATAARCYAYYFEGASAVNDQVNLSSAQPVLTDLNATYTRTSDAVFVKAALTPATSRLRFCGTAGRQFTVSGTVYYSLFDLTSATLSQSSTPVTLSIESNGYTPYAYLTFPAETRNLTVFYDGLVFQTTCDHPVMDVGQSGYMELPTETQHNGWELVKITEPTVGNLAVSNVGISKASFSARLTDAGNGTVTDCGFCYSKSPNPTTSDQKVSYGVASGTFGKTVSNLEENTTYYVRAYAVNEVGTGYSEETSFTTLAVTTPTLSTVTVSELHQKSAAFAAQVTSAGNGTITDAGFVYATTHYPTLNDKKISCGKTTTLQATASNLEPSTTYYVRAYATNEKGTDYGAEKSFQTLSYEVIPYTTITLETSYGSLTFDMATVTGGSFVMGAQSTSTSSANYDAQADSNEKPVHNVTVSTFYMGKTPVTQYLWYVVMGSYPAITSAHGLGENYPIYNVTYAQCQNFITKLNQLTGKKFRLPTEAEWEFAARGGNNNEGNKYAGSNTIGEVAWYSSNAGGNKHPVAQKSANQLNIYDLNGNVWEWCSDRYGNYSMSDQTNPTGATTGSSRVIRGGAYNDAATECRVSARSYASESSSFETLGFRLVME
jgi:formylglycine-generating enzyme required for sulfatase activity